MHKSKPGIAKRPDHKKYQTKLDLRSTAAGVKQHTPIKEARLLLRDIYDEKQSLEERTKALVLSIQCERTE